MTGFWLSDFLLLVAVIFIGMLFWQFWPVWVLLGIGWLIGEQPSIGWPVLGILLMLYVLFGFKIKW